MISTFTSLNRLIRRPSVDNAIGHLNKAVNQLDRAHQSQHATAERHLKTAERHLAASTVATDRARTARNEASRAARVRDNIASLLK